jgi:hypothetical protein
MRNFTLSNRSYLHDAALVQVCDDVDDEDLSGIYELLRFVPEENLYKFLSDDLRAQLDATLDALTADARACGEDDEPELTVIKLGDDNAKQDEQC